jgi:3-oxoacyl-(acyl-carrier-protein) synthase
LLAGKSGVTEISSFDTAGYSTRFAGEIKVSVLVANGPFVITRMQQTAQRASYSSFSLCSCGYKVTMARASRVRCALASSCEATAVPPSATAKALLCRGSRSQSLYDDACATAAAAAAAAWPLFQSLDAEGYIAKKQERRLDKAIKFVLVSGKKALADAGLDWQGDDIKVGGCVGGL